VELEITDDGGQDAEPARREGRGESEGDGGRGLLGMQERARLFGGELSAGPGAEGFAVTARLPLEVPAK